MRTVKLSVVLISCAFIVLTSGCNAELKDCKIQNATQQKRIAELESEVQTARVKLDQLQRQLESAEGRGGVEIGTLQQKIAALEEDLAKKKELIASMQQQLISGGASLPVELSTMLEDFAKDKEMVEYDSSRGIVKFKSDLLFEVASDEVAPAAGEVVKSLCKILDSEQGLKFDIIIAGHTDDIRIGKPDTRVKHPTNWHLSAHRAISVLDIMANNGVSSERLSVRGFGEFRPIAPNTPNKKGNAQNRRVEIYIVPQGM
ncbi:MAG: OmpA family protein [Phycisphaerae bacterium]|nr:OmpA family protein [Phycisphaerae bacterium]